MNVLMQRNLADDAEIRWQGDVRHGGGHVHANGLAMECMARR